MRISHFFLLGSVGSLGSFGALACSSTSSTTSPTDASIDVGFEVAAPDAEPDIADASDVGDVPAEAATCNSGLTQPTPACQACQDANCCIVASDCATTKSKWSCSAAKICRENSCATECALSAPTCGDIIPDPVSCTDATRASCCAELTACAKSDECLALIYMCIDESACDPSKPCFKACRTKWPTGSSLFDALDTCGSKVSCP